jgi:hypothetical protein
LAILGEYCTEDKYGIQSVIERTILSTFIFCSQIQ